MRFAQARKLLRYAPSLIPCLREAPKTLASPCTSVTLSFSVDSVLNLPFLLYSRSIRADSLSGSTKLRNRRRFVCR